MVSFKNLPHLLQTDVLLASYPRSGNTWVMNLLYCLDFLVLEGYQHDLAAIHTAEDLPLSRLGTLPGIEHIKTTMGNVQPPFRVIKTHNLPDQQPMFRTLYLYRDGRDVLWSYYHYKRRFHGFTGSFTDFLKSPERPAKSWAEHVRQWLAVVQERPLLALRYEALLADPCPDLKRALAFLGARRSDSAIDDAITKCKFDRLKASERSKASPLANDTNLHFFRRGQAGEWKEVYTEEQLAIIFAEASEILQRLGYATG